MWKSWWLNLFNSINGYNPYNGPPINHLPAWGQKKGHRTIPDPRHTTFYIKRLFQLNKLKYATMLIEIAIGF